jgi:MSHA biogenesis protein MshO
MKWLSQYVGWIRPQAVIRRSGQAAADGEVLRTRRVTPLTWLTHPTVVCAAWVKRLFKSVGWIRPQAVIRRSGNTPALAVRRHAQGGFTLVELVMVITLAGLVTVMITSALSRPLEGFVAQSRRAELVDLAAGALNRMARDIRLAVPNSVRLNGSLANPAMEMFNVLNAGRYRPNRVGGDGLMFATGTAANCSASGNNCSAFQVLDAGFSVAGARWLVVYNIGSSVLGSNLWVSGLNPSVVSPDGSTFAVSALPGNESLISMAAPGGSFNFSFASPQRRFYLSDQIVGYRCDLDIANPENGKLIRFSRSARTPDFNQGSDAGPEAVAATHVTGCGMSYQVGSSQRAGLVTLRLQLTLEGESIELFQQVHVDNAP